MCQLSQLVSLRLCLLLCLQPPLVILSAVTACLSACASTQTRIEQCCMHVSGGCGVKHEVQCQLRGAPPAVVTVQLQWLTSGPNSTAVQKILERIDMVCFSLHAATHRPAPCSVQGRQQDETV